MGKLADNSTVVLQEVRSGKKELVLVSMRKYPSAVHATSILKSLNLDARDDSNGDDISIVENPTPRNTQFSTPPLPAELQAQGRETVNKYGGVNYNR